MVATTEAMEKTSRFHPDEKPSFGTLLQMVLAMLWLGTCFPMPLTASQLSPNSESIMLLFVIYCRFIKEYH